MITDQERRRRRLTYRFVQLGLIMLSVGIVVAFVAERRAEPKRRDPDVNITTDIPTVATLGAGDALIFNVDTTVELILRGDKMLAGLSPKMVDRIRSEIRSAGPRDKDGIGAAIATAVKDQVADKIAVHVEYPVRDIDDIVYQDNQIVVHWKTGKEQELFESFKKDGRRAEVNHFRREEALRFIELVKARQGQINR
jgi:hypothetical protein